MAFYGESTPIDSFVHDGIEVEIHVASKGPVHCDLPHEIDATTCDGCGAKVASTIVYFVIINNAIVEGIECSSAEMAREFAVSYISHLTDGQDRGMPGDDIRIDIEDPDEAKTLPPPPMKASKNGGVDWGMDAPKGNHPVSANLRVMRQLNWPAMITEIFDRHGIK